MPQDYLNLANALPGAQDYQSSLPFGMSMPTVLGMQADATRRQTMAPFLQQAGESNELSLQQERQKTQEFTSQPFIAQRLAAEQAKTAESKYKMADFAAQEARVPLEDRNKRAELANHFAQELDKPQQQMFMHMASQSDAMDDAVKKGDTMAQTAIKADVANRFIQMYPDRQDLADKIARSDAKHFSMAKDYVVHTAQHMQDMEKESMKEAESTKRTGLTVAGELQRNRDTLDASKTPEQALNNAKGRLRTNLTPQQRAQFEDQIDAANDQISNNEADKRFKPRDQVSDLLARVQMKQIIAEQRKAGMDISPQDEAQMIQDAPKQMEKDRENFRKQNRNARGYTMSYLRRVDGGKSTDAEIRAWAQKNKIPVIE